MVPATVQNLYNLTTNTMPRRSANAASITTSNAVAEMQHALGPEGFDEHDLNTYQKAMHLPTSLVPAQVAGGHNDGIDQTGECTMGHGFSRRPCAGQSDDVLAHKRMDVRAGLGPERGQDPLPTSCLYPGDLPKRANAGLPTTAPTCLPTALNSAFSPTRPTSSGPTASF